MGEPEIIPLQWLISLDDRVSTPLRALTTLQQKFMEGVGKLKRIAAETWARWFKDTDEATKKTGVFKGMLDKVLENFKGLLNLVGKVGGLLVSVAAGAIAMGASMVKAAINARAPVLLLNQALDMTGKQMGVVRGLVDTWWAKLGYTREEAIQVARLGLELGILADQVRGGTGRFKEWTNQTLLFARATGTSTQAVGQFFFRMAQVYQLGYQPLRQLASAFKYIGDKTALAHEELLSFAETLDELLVLTNKTGDALLAYTVKTAAVEGALKQYGITFSRTFPALAKMLDVTSAEGQGALSRLALFTKTSARDLRGMISDEPQKLAAVLARTVKGFAPLTSAWGMQQHKLMAEALGVAPQELAKYARVSTGELEKFVADAVQKGSAGADAHGKAARKTVDGITQALANLSKQLDLLWIRAGEKLIPLVNQYLLPMLERLTTWLSAHGDEFAEAIRGIAEGFVSAGKWLFEFFKTNFETKMAMLWRDIILPVGTLIGEVLAEAWIGFTAFVERTDWGEVLYKLGEWLYTAGEYFYNGMVAAHEQVVDWLAMKGIPQMIEQYGYLFKELGNLVEQYIKRNPVSEKMVVPLWDWIVQPANVYKDFIGQIGFAFTSVNRGMTETGKQTWAQLGQIANDGVASIAGRSPGGVLERIGKKWQSIMDDMVARTKTATESMARLFQNMIDTATRMFAGSSEDLSAAAMETYIQGAATKFNVPAALIKAVIQAESGWDPTKRTGEHVGLMQLSPAAAKDVLGKVGWGAGDMRTSARWNIEAGTAYLAEKYAKFGDWEKALTAYRWGAPGLGDTGYAQRRLEHAKEWERTPAPAANVNAVIAGAVTIDDRNLLAKLEAIRTELIRLRTGQPAGPGKVAAGTAPDIHGGLGALA